MVPLEPTGPSPLAAGSPSAPWSCQLVLFDEMCLILVFFSEVITMILTGTMDLISGEMLLFLLLLTVS